MKKSDFKILIVDDDKNVCSAISRLLHLSGYSSLEAGNGEEALRIMKTEVFDIALLDIYMPGMNGIELLKRIKDEYPGIEVIMITGGGTIETAVEAMKLGAFDYIQKPLATDHLLLLIDRIIEKRELLVENVYLVNELGKRYHFDNIVGQSPQMLKLFEEVKRVSGTNATVLITGESGTGKELIASTIHYSSLRKTKPFIKLSCAALSPGTIESELFGHEKGAFTSAISKRSGRFEMADGGTFFLDEIGDMPLETQVKLLRVLDSQEFERVGGNETLKVNIRLISATNRDLKKLVYEKKFREDLFYRLNVILIHNPPLRERKRDIELLARHFLHKYAIETSKKIDKISSSAMALLHDYSWPGNVRELENAIERAVVFCQKRVIRPEDLPEQIRDKIEPSGVTMRLPYKNLALAEKTLITSAIKEVNGNLKKASDILGISRGTLYSKMEKHGIKREGNGT